MSNPYRRNQGGQQNNWNSNVGSNRKPNLPTDQGKAPKGSLGHQKLGKDTNAAQKMEKQLQRQTEEAYYKRPQVNAANLSGPESNKLKSVSSLKNLNQPKTPTSNQQQNPQTFRGRPSLRQPGKQEAIEESNTQKDRQENDYQDKTNAYQASKYSLSRQNYGRKIYQKNSMHSSKSEQNLHDLHTEGKRMEKEVKIQEGQSVSNQVKRASEIEYSNKGSDNQSQPLTKFIMSQSAFLNTPSAPQQQRRSPSPTGSAMKSIQEASDRKIKEVIEYANKINQKNRELTEQFYKFDNQKNNYKVQLQSKDKQLVSLTQKLKIQQNRYDKLANEHKQFRPSTELEDIRKAYEDNLKVILKKHQNLNVQLRGKTEQIYQLNNELTDANSQKLKVKQQKDALQSNLEKYKSQLKSRQTSITKKQTEIQQFRQKTEKLGTRNKELEQRISQIRIQMSERLDQLTSSSSQEKDKVIRSNIKQINALKNDLKVKCEIIENIEARNRELSQSIVQKQKQYKDWANKMQSDKNEKIRSFQKIVVEKERQIERARVESMSFIAGSESRISLKNKDRTVQQLIRTHTNDINALYEQLNSKIQQNFELKSEIINVRSKNNNLQNEVNSLRAKVASLENNQTQRSDIEMIRLSTDVSNLQKKLEANQKILQSRNKQISHKDTFIKSHLMGAMMKEDLPALVEQLKKIYNTQG